MRVGWLSAFFLIVISVAYAQVKRKTGRLSSVSDSISRHLNAGDAERARHHAELWLRKCRKNPGKDSLQYAEALMKFGEVCIRGDYFPEAETALRRALAIRRNALGPDNILVAQAQVSLGNFYRAERNFSKARPLFLHALEIFETNEKLLQKTLPGVAATLSLLDSVCQEMGEIEKSIPYVRQLNKINARNRKPSYRKNPLEDSVRFYEQAGISGKAVYFAGLWLKKSAKNPGTDSLDYAAALLAYGNAISQDNNPEEAGLPLRKALALRNKVLEQEHPEIAEAYVSLGSCYMAVQNYEKAKPLFLQALDIYETNEKLLEVRLPGMALALNQLGNLFTETGEMEKALPFFRRLRKMEAQDRKPSYQTCPLEDSVRKYEKTGKYVQALKFSRDWLGKTSRKPGKDSLDYAAALHACGNVLQHGKKPSAAEPYLRKALAIRRRILVEEHLDVAASLLNLGNLYSRLLNYEKAKPLLLHALEIYETNEQLLEKGLPEVASTLNALAQISAAIGENEKAESYYLIALETRKNTMGPDHADVGLLMRDLGQYYLSRGDFFNAESYFTQALDIQLDIFGTDNPESAFLMNVTGKLSWQLGDYAKAETLFRDAIRSQKKIMGTDNLALAASMSNYGELYQSLGEYARSEAYLLEALGIRKRVLGPGHPVVAGSLHNAGNLYLALGEYQKAENYFRQAMEIRNRFPENKQLELASSFNSLGEIFTISGKFEEAESHLLKGLSIRKSAHGDVHPDVATSLRNLGRLYSGKGLFPQADSCLKMSMEIRKKTLGANHPEVADALANLALLAHQQGEHKQAIAYYNEVREMKLKVLGQQHPDIKDADYYLYLFQRLENNTAEAARFARDVAALDISLIRKYFPSLSDQERESFLQRGAICREHLKSFWAEEGSRQPAFREELFNQQLFFKGLLLNTSARWKQRIKTCGDKKLIQRFFDWESLQHKISNLFTSNDANGRAGIDSLVQKAELLEKELSQRSENFARGEDRKPRSWKEIQAALQPGEAAVEMVRFRKFHRTPIAGLSAKTSEGLSDTIQYAALILTKNGGSPELVLLPDGNLMETKWLMEYRKAIHSINAHKIAYNQYWKPIAEKIKGLKKIWFSADGIYHQISIHCLMNPQSSEFLMDETEIALLGSSRDLLREFPDESENHLACLFGNPEFQGASGKLRSGPDISYFLKPNPNIQPTALPGTQEEVDSIAGILENVEWEVKQFTGKSATEEKVKDCYKPRVMLLSTHGYFQSDSSGSRNPLTSSGLLLSGAGKTMREGHPGNGEDGILTAYEAMNLNLDNTELVVLSACETGLGEIRNGEGVYGLQRAFQVAGARNVIMSLWKVDDEVTKKLMISFFRNWLSGMEKRRAFFLAQKEIRRQHSKPYYWGGFVLLGK